MFINQRPTTGKKSSGKIVPVIKTNERVQQVINEVILIIRSQIGKDKDFQPYLFGSRTYDEHENYRDIDLALSTEYLSSEMYRKIKRAVEDISTLYTVDLVHLQRVDSAFKELLLSTAKKIYG